MKIYKRFIQITCLKKTEHALVGNELIKQNAVAINVQSVTIENDWIISEIPINCIMQGPVFTFVFVDLK